MTPLLFLDVDGVLIPFGRSDIPTFGDNPDAAHPLLTRVDPALGPRLAALPLDLVWATTWEEDANDLIAPRLGLGRLPVVEWIDADPPVGVHWKTASLVEAAGSRPFAWIDDELTGRDQQWIDARHPASVLLLKSRPDVGLTFDQLEEIADWARGAESLDG
ncbi:HAD domain-containing protein [Ammonicoccus fulvus]|uniref:HAD domain-containing protein n=1 Tax=Ammonicoccus fulvus TaxID=3138240 RepID=UPI003CC808C1